MKTLILSLTFILTMMSATESTIYQFTMPDIEGEMVSLEKYKGKVVLIVNVASKCGLTPQYKELQELYNNKADAGLVILGFPANNFAGQEPGSEEEIATFCEKNYGVTFPMFSKISVKGDDQHPLYQFLTQKDLNGVMDSDVKWNFQKYLIDREGKLVEMISPRTSVTEASVRSKIDALLAQG
jgi:glutathione peroxidase